MLYGLLGAKNLDSNPALQSNTDYCSQCLQFFVTRTQLHLRFALCLHSLCNFHNNFMYVSRHNCVNSIWLHDLLVHLAIWFDISTFYAISLCASTGMWCLRYHTYALLHLIMYLGKPTTDLIHLFAIHATKTCCCTAFVCQHTIAVSKFNDITWSFAQLVVHLCIIIEIEKWLSE